jgi:hypothetical protein
MEVCKCRACNCDVYKPIKDEMNKEEFDSLSHLWEYRVCSLTCLRVAFIEACEAVQPSNFIQNQDYAGK